MRVNSTQYVPNIYGFNRSNEQTRITRKQESADSYEISAKAKLYSTVRKALNTVPDIREDKVNEVKQKYENGYSISSDMLAEKMLSPYKPLDEKI